MKISYLGGGNMAAALIGGWIASGKPPSDITVLEQDTSRAQQLSERFGVQVTQDPQTALNGCNMLVLAVKPQQMKEACASVQPFVAQAAVLSIAAGVRIAQLTQWLGSERVLRAMPNTPALVGAGVSAVVATAAVDEAAKAQAQSILEAAGAVIWLDKEPLLDVVTALSGSGPAYVFYVLEALIKAGQALGLTQQAAHTLAVHTVIGAGQLAARSDEPIATLRERVTSKGGTTAAGLESLRQDGVDAALVRAVEAAHRRAVELGDAFG
ncbi:MAG TPA: pyrroline-5-carboxylate reductase [Burkholderiaceae bacterium]|nr:pyrroline-5-carboxylate reductase [Burkholderiaceae bacterium]